jgi:hypothetical protein
VDPRQRGHHLRSRQDAAEGSMSRISLESTPVSFPYISACKNSGVCL